MENLLLVFDEIDDVFSTLGLIWRPILSFVIAVAMFVGTGFVFFSAPWLAEAIGAALIAIGGLEIIRQRRMSRESGIDADNGIAAPVSATGR